MVKWETSQKLENVIRPGTSRGLDFVTLDELRKRTGINPDEVLKWALAEILCNALDKDATQIDVKVHFDGQFYTLKISDNGSQKLSRKEIELILDFENKASSKRGLLHVSRGYLGNALKCAFGYSYALAESKGFVPPDIIVSSNGFQHKIALKPDRIMETINTTIATTEILEDGLTKVTIKFPKDDKSIRQTASILKDLVFATSMVNPTRKICYEFIDEESDFNDVTVFGWVEQTKQIRQESSVLWYNPNQFESLFKDFVRASPETQLKELISLFRGFKGKKVIREILHEINVSNHDSGSSIDDVQFFPATTLKDIPLQTIQPLFNAMKKRAKPIAKRSFSAVLGAVGQDRFEKLRDQNGWRRLRYTILKEVKSEYYAGYTVKFPFLVELAVFDRAEDDMEGLKVYQCINFMASMEDIFSRVFDISYHLGRVGITQVSPVTVLVHLISPVLKWLNYGKSGIDE